jgi:hypothetical protein
MVRTKGPSNRALYRVVKKAIQKHSVNWEKDEGYCKLRKAVLDAVEYCGGEKLRQDDLVMVLPDETNMGYHREKMMLPIILGGIHGVGNVTRLRICKKCRNAIRKKGCVCAEMCETRVRRYANLRLKK